MHPSPRRWKTAVIGVAVLACIASLPAAAVTRRSRSFTIGSNTRLERVRYPDIPEEIRIVRLRPGTAVPDVVPADPTYPMWGYTSAISAAAGATVGVNGDFGTKVGQPKHVLMIDGEMWTTGQIGGNAVAWSASGDRAYLGHPALRVLAVDSTSGASFHIQGWNVGTPRAGTIGAYTARGGTITRPPGTSAPTGSDPRWCAARLLPSTHLGWSGPGRRAIVRTYTVAAQRDVCPKTPTKIGPTAGAVVVAKRFATGVRNKVRDLSVGDVVTISWSFAGWPGVTDVMGGQQLLVKDGVNVAPDFTPGSDHILNYNPRTSVGIGPGCSDTDLATTCRLILITVDGRQTATNWSMGVRLPFLAKMHLRAGATFALNLDGGGSTTMWVRRRGTYCQSVPPVGGCLVNRPSESYGERVTRSAIVVLPTADDGTPHGLR
jgi:Phosphodiester glycosidase